MIHPRRRAGDTGFTVGPVGSLSILGLVLLALLAGCTGLSGEAPVGQSSPNPHTTTTATDVASDTRATESSKPTKAGPPALGGDLYGLTQADNRTAYAQDHGFELRNDSVLVTVELREGRDIPADVDADVRARAGSQVDAYVPIDQLEALARHENTTSVRPPERPEPLNDASVPGTH